eukprot:gene8062-9656_t
MRGRQAAAAAAACAGVLLVVVAAAPRSAIAIRVALAAGIAFCCGFTLFLLCASWRAAGGGEGASCESPATCPACDVVEQYEHHGMPAKRGAPAAAAAGSGGKRARKGQVHTCTNCDGKAKTVKEEKGGAPHRIDTCPLPCRLCGKNKPECNKGKKCKLHACNQARPGDCGERPVRSGML